MSANTALELEDVVFRYQEKANATFWTIPA